MKEFSDYQQYIAKSRYSRYLPEEQRRETWEETVNRYCDFFAEKNSCFPREKAFHAIHDLKSMPSMRCLMTAGKALDRDNAAGYNCSYLAVDNQRAFDESFYLLMCGVGVGYSVERQFIAKLPTVSEEFFDTDSVITVKDSRIGWASALRELISLLYQGLIPKWDVSKVRPSGTPLKTFGGRSSGPEPLEELFRFVIHIFQNAQGRKLNSLECNDLLCKIGEAVVVGGVRRSACISLTNLSDDRMRLAKSGQWWIDNGQRALANISVAYTEKPETAQFMEEWLALYNSKSGERGIFNRVAAVKKATELGRRDPSPLAEHGGANPCGEIVLRSNQFCNLTEVVIRADDTLETLLEKVEMATILGTFQSTLTDFRYLRSSWKKNTEEERLLGVSLTGIMDHRVMSGQEGREVLAKWLTELRQKAIDTNDKWSDTLGIEQSVALTTIKPSGCTTLETKVKTTDGIKSMASIFSENYDGNIFELNRDTWIEPKNDIFVYDENNDIQKVSKLYINGMSEVYEIKDDTGTSYKFTGNHKLKTSNRGWVRVDELNVDDDVSF